MLGETKKEDCALPRTSTNGVGVKFSSFFSPHKYLAAPLAVKGQKEADMEWYSARKRIHINFIPFKYVYIFKRFRLIL